MAHRNYGGLGTTGTTVLVIVNAGVTVVAIMVVAGVTIVVAMVVVAQARIAPQRLEE